MQQKNNSLQKQKILIYIFTLFAINAKIKLSFPDTILFSDSDKLITLNDQYGILNNVNSSNKANFTLSDRDHLEVVFDLIKSSKTIEKIKDAVR